MNPVVHSSVEHTWQTPESFLELVRAIGPIALDPCTSVGNPTKAAVWCTGRLMHMTNPPRVIDDGLTAPWTQYAEGGLVYVNPPYGRALGAWAAKCVEEARLGAEIVLLVPARPDTQWFEHLWHADALLFWKGRLKFKGATAGAPFPSAVAYWGHRERCFREAFAGKGRFV